MKVKAVFSGGRFGFYGEKRRYDGDIFDLTDAKHFSSSWMEKVDAEPKAARKSKTAQKTEIEQSGVGAE